MKIDREQEENRQVVLNIEMEEPDLESYLDQAFKRLVQRIRVPGFRKGKAPRAVVEREVGKEALLQEALDFLVPDVALKAIDQEGLDLAAQPDVELMMVDPVKVKAVVPLFPTVEIGEYKNVRMEQEQVNVEEERVVELLENLRQEAKRWQPVERPAMMDDLLLLSVQGSVDGNIIMTQQDVQYIIGTEHRPAEGFGDRLTGINAGETREFELLLPEDAPEHGAKMCQFTVDVKGIKESILPDLDDDFAKSVGNGFDSLELLHDEVENQLRGSLEEHARHGYEDAVVDQVLAISTIEMPSLLVEREVNRLVDDLRSGAERRTGRSVDIDEYISAIGKTVEELQTELKPEANSRLQKFYVLKKLAELEGIEVTDDDIDTEVDTLVTNAGAQGNQIRRLFKNDSNRDSLLSSLRSRRALERMVHIASEAEPSEDSMDRRHVDTAQTAETQGSGG